MSKQKGKSPEDLWAVGYELPDGEYAMTHGPYKLYRTALKVCPRDEHPAVILHYHTEVGGRAPTTTVVNRWSRDCWLKADEALSHADNSQPYLCVEMAYVDESDGVTSTRLEVFQCSSVRGARILEHEANKHICERYPDRISEFSVYVLSAVPGNSSRLTGTIDKMVAGET